MSVTWESISQCIIHAAGIWFLRDNPERFIESNLEQFWVQYLSNMSCQAGFQNVLKWATDSGKVGDCDNQGATSSGKCV